MNASWLHRILHEPLVHFLAIGAGLFLVYAVVQPHSPAADSRINIDRYELQRLAALWQAQWKRPPTHDDGALMKAAKQLFHRVWDGKTPLRLLGVGTMNLSEDTQRDFFQAKAEDRREKLLQTIDRISDREGSGKLVWGTAIEEPPNIPEKTE